jgi:hypothetical protein
MSENGLASMSSQAEKIERFYVVGAVCPESGESAGQKPIPIGINPVENLWHYLRSHYLANRIYADYDALRLAAVDAWQKAALDKEIVRSVCFTKYAQRIY